MKNLSPREWAQEYELFLAAAEQNPPQAIDAAVRGEIHERLHPPAWRVFFKMAGLHVLAGSIMLMLCPQFGFSLIAQSGLMGFFMPFGPVFCSFACGVSFVGLTAFLTSVFLQPEEVKVLRRSRVLLFALLALLSLGAFISFGADVLEIMTIVWLLGSVVGASALLELGWVLRRGFFSRAGS